MPAPDAIVYATWAEWWAEGVRLFGPNHEEWKFVCPVCAHVAAVKDFKQYKEQGATPSSATCECIGRYTGAKDFRPPGTGPCNYAGYGLFRLSPVRVKGQTTDELIHSFAFAGEKAAGA